MFGRRPSCLETFGTETWLGKPEIPLVPLGGERAGFFVHLFVLTREAGNSFNLVDLIQDKIQSLLAVLRLTTHKRYAFLTRSLPTNI